MKDVFELARENFKLRKELAAAKAVAEEWRQVALEGQVMIEQIKRRLAELLERKRGH
jgi:hypothetical protein